MSPIDFLRRHVRDERHFYDEGVFNSLQAQFPVEDKPNRLKKDGYVRVYKGINFKKQEAYDEAKSSYMSKGYVRPFADSWTPCFDEAKGFSEITKTYFVDEHVLSSYADMVSAHEDVAGYGGMVLEAWVHEDDLVDVCASGEAIEDELLLRPNKTIEVSHIHEVKTFRRQIEEGLIDINETLVKLRGNMDESLVRHIVSCHMSKTTEDTAQKIFDIGMDVYMQSLRGECDFETLEMFQYEDRDISGYVYKDFNDAEPTLNMIVPSILVSMAEKGLFNESQFNELQDLMDEIAEGCVELIEQTGISNLGYCKKYLLAYSSDDVKEHLFLEINRKHGEQFRALHDNVRSINKLPEAEFKVAVDDFISKMTAAVNGISTNMPTDFEKETIQLETRTTVKPRIKM